MRRLDRAEAERARKLRALGPRTFTVAALADLFQTSPYQVERALEPDRTRQRNDASNIRRKKREARARQEGRRPLDAWRRERWQKLARLEVDDGRDLTGRLLGDPLRPGASP